MEKIEASPTSLTIGCRFLPAIVAGDTTMEVGRTVKRTLLWLIVAAVLVIGFVIYRSGSRRKLNVDPDAREENREGAAAVSSQDEGDWKTGFWGCVL